MSAATWTAAVRLAREGAIEGLRAEDGEIELRVRTRGRPVPYEVFLWPEDGDWGCDCGQRLPCVHICAAAIATKRGLQMSGELPETATRYRVSLRYDFQKHGPKLSVRRTIVWPDGRTAPLEGLLADSNLMASRGDTQAEALLAMHTGGPFDEDRLRRLLVMLEGKPEATLDGQPVQLSAEAVPFEIRVRDEGDLAFRVGVYRPSGLDQLFLGGAMVDGVLRPTTWGELPADERRALHPRRAERVYSMDKVGWLLAEYLPRLRRFGLPVIIETDRLPTAEALKPRIEVHLREVHEGLEVRPDMVYGDPPIARVSEGKLVKLGAAVPVRDHGAERRLERSFHEQHKLWPGHTKVLPPSDAAQFLSTGMHRMQAEIKGDVDIRRFRVVQAPVMPAIDVGPDGEGYRLDVSFSGPEGQADPTAVLHAWQRRQPLVPLMDGGYAPIPQDWLKEHGALLLELWEARDHSGRVSRNATAALVELMEDTEGEAPPDLKRLRTFLEGGEGLPDVELPAAFDAELRPYQEVGFRWLMFLREMDLNGVLADDMGLGKTVQALAALASTPGRHLVVAPTSVLDNWQRESERFWKGVKVCRYHGPQRSLDPNADIVLTSYGLLRMDLDRLRELEWSYLVLDEAQAIKNPRSQTARSAFAMPSTHRLALTGTPVENRLDELWSLFRFLMPGLLGTIGTFRERFVRPMEVGDPAAGEALRKRVRPYVLRRMKRQVAQDLPPLTEVVVRCPMAKEQRLVYDAVRTSARSDVLRGLVGTKKERGWSVQVLEALLRMRQACCDPSLLPGGIGDGAPAAKLDRLEEMLTDLVVEGHKALVFSQFTSLLDRVEPRLEELGIDYVRLDGSTRDRMAVIDRFQDPDGPPVFLLSLKAGGTGLNLTAADYVVHLDPWWNPAVERQATDRAHRIGQTRPVVSYRLIAEDTVEVRILALQEAKEGLAEAALGGEGGLLRALTADEIRMLFDAA